MIILPHWGAVVRRPNAGESQDIYDIRVTLEEMVWHLAVPRVTEDTLADLTSLLHQMEKHEGQIATTVLKLNHRFHLNVYAASDRTLRYRTQHYLHLSIVEEEMDSFHQRQGEHQAILAACKRGDAEQASAIIFDHEGFCERYGSA